MNNQILFIIRKLSSPTLSLILGPENYLANCLEDLINHTAKDEGKAIRLELRLLEKDLLHSFSSLEQFITLQHWKHLSQLPDLKEVH